MSEAAPEKQSEPKRIGTGLPGPGRKPGVPNKIGASAKNAFQAAFDQLGGVEGLVKWARADEGKNLTDFYKLYARLIPTDLKVETPDLKDLQPRDALSIARDLLHLAQLGVQTQPTQH